MEYSLEIELPQSLHPDAAALFRGRTSPNPERVSPLTLNTSSHRTAQDEKDFISELSLEALDLLFESLEILKRWGINTAGAFLALGKDQLATRLELIFA